MLYGTIEKVEDITIKNNELKLIAEGVEFVLEPKDYTLVDEQATDIMESAFNALYFYYYKTKNMSRSDVEQLLNDKLDDMRSRIY